MKIVRDILSLGLSASSLIGSMIVLNDRWLWSVAQSHAFGLLVFVVVDALLTIAVLNNISTATLGAVIASVIQFGAMILDLLAGQPQGVPQAAFRAYLTSDPSYLILLVIQIAIATVAIGRLTTPWLRRHTHWMEFRHCTSL